MVQLPSGATTIGDLDLHQHLGQMDANAITNGHGRQPRPPRRYWDAPRSMEQRHQTPTSTEFMAMSTTASPAPPIMTSRSEDHDHRSTNRRLPVLVAAPSGRSDRPSTAPDPASASAPIFASAPATTTTTATTRPRPGVPQGSSGDTVGPPWASGGGGFIGHVTPAAARRLRLVSIDTRDTTVHDNDDLDRACTMDYDHDDLSPGSHDHVYGSVPSPPSTWMHAPEEVITPTRGAASRHEPQKSMDLQDLQQLRDWLVKSSMSGTNPLLTSGRGPHAPPTLAQSGLNFVNVSHPRLSDIPRGDAHTAVKPSMTSSVLPRESMAVLIDAVRASTLQDHAKSRFLFDTFDVQCTGALSREGVTAFIDGTLAAGNLQCYGNLRVDDLIDRIFAKCVDPDHLTYAEFHVAFAAINNPDTGPMAEVKRKQSRGTSNATSSATVLTASTDVENMPPATSHSQAPRHRRSVHFRRENVAKRKKNLTQRLKKQLHKYDAEIFWLGVYAGLMVTAFFLKATRLPFDPAVGHAARIAKGFAQVVMVNTLFLLFPLCRNFVAFIRRFGWITARLPVDQNIEFHKVCGIVMLVASLGHTIGWVFIVYYAKTAPLVVWRQSNYYHLNFVREESVLKLLERTPIWSGVLMLLIAMVAAPMTHPAFRRGNFNAFWFTHMFFVLFLVLILVHGLAMWVNFPQAWFWIIPPLLLYFVEKRFRVSRAFGGRTDITHVHFSQDTVAIYLKKPKSFHYLPGMYLYLNLPVISTNEWHPFTISSAPEDPHLSLHIRNAGDWTGALHALLRQIQDRHQAQVLIDREGVASTQPSPYPSVCIDGPVGAPSQDFYRYQSVVFVGAGIGVTPFASILRSIVHQWETFRCPCCDTVTFPKSFKLRKIYFYWITREQEALTWFKETMNQLAQLDSENRLEIHNYYSPLKRESVIAPLRALQTFIHDAQGEDIISGLATKQITHFGRPDWKEELERIAKQQQDLAARDMEAAAGVSGEDEQYSDGFSSPTTTLVQPQKEEVGVFFCGPKPMGAAIHEECTLFNHDKRSRYGDIEFAFHKENF